jgi:hypothetical protein
VSKVCATSWSIWMLQPAKYKLDTKDCSYKPWGDRHGRRQPL